MGLVSGTYKVAESFCKTNLSAGELWKHFPAYVAFAALGYFMGSGGCSAESNEKLRSIDTKIEEKMPEAVRDANNGIRGFFEKYR